MQCELKTTKNRTTNETQVTITDKHNAIRKNLFGDEKSEQPKQPNKISIQELKDTAYNMYTIDMDGEPNPLDQNIEQTKRTYKISHKYLVENGYIQDDSNHQK